MAPKTLVELPARRPLAVASAGGTLWLTIDNDPRDLVLEQGERALLEARERVLVYALGDAVLEVLAVEHLLENRAIPACPATDPKRL